MYQNYVDPIRNLGELRNLIITMGLYIEESSTISDELDSMNREMLEKANAIHRWFIRNPHVIDDEIWKWSESHEQE